jgi:hypothetical protein
MAYGNSSGPCRSSLHWCKQVLLAQSKIGTKERRSKEVEVHILRLRDVELEELLSEEVVLRKDPDDPFPGPGDRPEPYRTLYIAAARMQPVFKKENVYPPFIIITPRGRGLLWRWWPDQIGVILFAQAPNGKAVVSESHVTFLNPAEQELVTLDLSQIVLNPPA